MSETIDPHAVTAPWVADILDFWFKEAGPDAWWSHRPELDAACAARFSDLWREKRDTPASDFLKRADMALAAILLFDQLPRNMFRGAAQAFATDPLARNIARGAVSHGYDIQIGGAGRPVLLVVLHDPLGPPVVLFEPSGDPLGGSHQLGADRSGGDLRVVGRRREPGSQGVAGSDGYRL